MHGHIVYHSLVGKSSACTDCPSVFIDPVPEGPQSIALNVVLETGIEAERLSSIETVNSLGFDILMDCLRDYSYITRTI